MSQWLIETTLASDQNVDHLKAVVAQRFRELLIEPPTAERIERLIRSACATYEQLLFDQILERLSASTRAHLDDLLVRSSAEESAAGDEEWSAKPPARPTVVTWHDLKTNPGAVGLDSVLLETDKLRLLAQLDFPDDLFAKISPKVLTLYRERAATETTYELRRHPDAMRYTYLAAFCLQRKAEIIDSLIELLLLVVHRIETKADKRISKQYLDEVKRVDNKPRLLFQVAEAALEHPDQKIREGIYTVMSEQKCREIVKEYKAKGEYQQQVYQRMRSSYRDHYRRMMPGLLNMLEFRSNNEAYRPVIKALTLLKRYIGVPGVYYPLEENPPLDGVVRPMWHDLVVEKDHRESSGSTG